MRARRILIWMIAIAPWWRLRGLLYGLVPGYSVDRSARIGWLANIDVKKLLLGRNSRIGGRTHLRGPMSVELGEGAILGGGNRVECGRWYAELDQIRTPITHEFVLGDKAVVSSGHYFDAIGGIRIGQGSVVAGRGSQFLTHGLGVEDLSISIGRYCYVGSAVRFAPGSRIGDLAVVGLGSVVTSDLSGSTEVLIAGVPAEVVRDEYRPAGLSTLERPLEDGEIEFS